MPTRKDLNNDYLLCYSLEHVWYETHMAFDTGFLLDNSGFQSNNPTLTVVLRNLVIEGFPIHLRNLLDFFYPTSKQPRPTDVLASDYFDEGKLPRDFPEITATLESARIRAHKEVSHLTMLRKNPGEREGWRAKPLLCELVPVVDCFIKRASHRKLHRTYVSRTTELLNNFARTR